MSDLADVDRLTLINDASAFGRAGYAPASRELAYVAGLPIAADPIVWRRAVGAIAAIDAAYRPGPARTRFRRWASGLLAPLAARTGLDERPDEDANVGELRADLVILLARLGDERVRRWAQSVEMAKTGTASDRQTALAVTALTADAAGFDILLRRVEAERDPLRESLLLRPMTLVADPALAARLAGFILKGGAPAGATGTFLVATARTNPDAVWATLLPHLDDRDFPLGLEEQLYIIPKVASGSSDPVRIAQLRAWADRHLPADTRQGEHAAETTIRQNATFEATAIPDIDQWLEGPTAQSRS